MAEFITVADIITVCGQNAHLESGRVAPWITQAHRRLEKIMGRTGYAQLESEGSAHANWTALFTNYIKEYLCWTALELSYPSLHSQATRTGIHTKSDENYSTVDSKALAMLVSAARGAQETAQARLIDHILDNLTTYTWYGTNVAGEERITDNVGGAGIIMRRSTRQNQYRG